MQRHNSQESSLSLVPSITLWTLNPMPRHRIHMYPMHSFSNPHPNPHQVSMPMNNEAAFQLCRHT